MLKKFSINLIVTLCVLFCAPLQLITPIYGATDASISVEYVYDNQPLSDVEIEIYLVAVWHNGQYVLTSEFSDSEVDFTDLTTPSLWRDEGIVIQDYIHDEDCTCQSCQYTDSAGTTSFTQLDHGIYYVDVADVSYEDGTLSSIPVLLTLPAYDNATDTYTYDVVMEPKVVYIEDPEVPTTPSKPDEPDDPDEPDIPEIPEIPENPEIPEIPETPNDPDRPKIPTIPTEPDPSDDPDDPLFGIPDPDVPRDYMDDELPQTGTNAWMILPLFLTGWALLFIAIFLFKEKKVKP